MDAPHLDTYSLMITSKYFNSKSDFISLICVNSKFRQIVDMFRYNPIIDVNKSLFHNIQTQYVYAYETLVPGVDKYVIWRKVNYEEYKENQKPNIQFKNVVFDMYHYHSLNFIPSCCNEIKPYQFCVLTTLHIPNTITSLTNNCFDQSSLTAITLSTSIRRIPNNCFKNCCKLKEINLCYITYISDCAFENCIALSSVVLSKHLNHISFTSFISCSSLISITIKPKPLTFTCVIPYHLSLIIEKNNVQCLNVF
ncbi:Leucine rich repeat containing protein BspA family protein [Entamoeba marina]